MTANGPIDKRHVSTESFDRYLGSRVPVVLAIQGEPKAFIFIEPSKTELGLRIEVDPTSETPSTGLRNVVARTTAGDGTRFLEVVVTAPALFRDAYPILCSMADRVQVDGLSAAVALRATLDNMSSLLRAPDSMSREREVGLFGELLVLISLMDVLGPHNAVQAWRGGEAEEHDFGLPAGDLEVKTTTAETRTHWVESLTQLVPTLDRPLWLISHQVTAAGAGFGQTLPELIDLIRGRIRSGPDHDRFERGLAGSGWLEEQRARFVSRWTPRTDSLAYLVSGAFPRLTPDALRRSGLPMHRIPEVRYRIDLDGLPAEEALPETIAPLTRLKDWL